MRVGVLGALAGAVGGVVLLALASGLLLEQTLDAVPLSPQQGIARPLFVPTAGAMYLFVVVAGAALGAILSAATVGLARKFNPEEPRFGPLMLVVIGAATSAITAYAAVRGAVGWVGSIDTDTVTGATVVTLRVFRAAIIAVVVGATAGFVTTVTVEVLSRVEVVALEGEAWPKSRFAFMKEAQPAMVIPIVAILTGAILVIGFAQLLLAGEKTVIVVTIFSAAAAGILAGAAFIAAHPPGGDKPPTEG